MKLLKSSLIASLAVSVISVSPLPIHAGDSQLGGGGGLVRTYWAKYRIQDHLDELWIPLVKVSRSSVKVYLDPRCFNGYNPNFGAEIIVTHRSEDGTVRKAIVHGYELAGLKKHPDDTYHHVNTSFNKSASPNGRIQVTVKDACD